MSPLIYSWYIVAECKETRGFWWSSSKFIGTKIYGIWFVNLINSAYGRSLDTLLHFFQYFKTFTLNKWEEVIKKMSYIPYFECIPTRPQLILLRYNIAVTFIETPNTWIAKQTIQVAFPCNSGKRAQIFVHFCHTFLLWREQEAQFILTQVFKSRIKMVVEIFGEDRAGGSHIAWRPALELVFLLGGKEDWLLWSVVF